MASSVVFGLVLAAWLLLPGRAGAPAPDPQRAPAQRPRAAAWLAGGLCALLLLAAAAIGGQVLASARQADALEVDVTARAGRWEVRHADGRFAFDELHVAAGRLVVMHLRTGDTIHSLGLPGLGARGEAIPGRTQRLTFRAERPGIYLGECTEVCGYTREQMAFRLHVHAPADAAHPLSQHTASRGVAAVRR